MEKGGEIRLGSSTIRQTRVSLFDSQRLNKKGVVNMAVDMHDAWGKFDLLQGSLGEFRLAFENGDLETAHRILLEAADILKFLLAEFK